MWLSPFKCGNGIPKGTMRIFSSGMPASCEINSACARVEQVTSSLRAIFAFSIQQLKRLSISFFQPRKLIISEEWEKRDVANTKELSSPFDALILASIVEKEAKLDEEKPYIAGAYLTRLKRKIPLQADPTVIYGISGKGNFSRKVTYADLKFDSPYNTYLYAGLPPTPICNPGKSSILAVLQIKRS